MIALVTLFIAVVALMLTAMVACSLSKEDYNLKHKSGRTGV